MDNFENNRKEIISSFLKESFMIITFFLELNLNFANKLQDLKKKINEHLTENSNTILSVEQNSYSSDDFQTADILKYQEKLESLMSNSEIFEKHLVDKANEQSKGEQETTSSNQLTNKDKNKATLNTNPLNVITNILNFNI